MAMARWLPLATTLTFATLISLPGCAPESGSQTAAKYRGPESNPGSYLAFDDGDVSTFCKTYKPGQQYQACFDYFNRIADSVKHRSAELQIGNEFASWRCTLSGMGTTQRVMITTEMKPAEVLKRLDEAAARIGGTLHFSVAPINCSSI